MSLINDALKKAQHERTGPPKDQPPMPGTPQGYRAAQLNKPSSGMPTQTLLLIGGGVVGLVVLCVVVTVMIVRPSAAPRPLPPERPIVAKPAPEVVTTPAPATVVPAQPAASPKIELPTIVVAPPPAPAKAEPVVTPAPSTPAPATVAVAPTNLPSAARAPAASEAEPIRAVAPGSQDVRILTLIDSFRVTGIRSSGEGSKVLMNDRVYRINDMVDYTLGIRLTKVAADSLTFVDSNGTVYVKNF